MVWLIRLVFNFINWIECLQFKFDEIKPELTKQTNKLHVINSYFWRSIKPLQPFKLIAGLISFAFRFGARKRNELNKTAIIVWIELQLVWCPLQFGIQFHSGFVVCCLAAASLRQNIRKQPTTKSRLKWCRMKLVLLLVSNTN